MNWTTDILPLIDLWSPTKQWTTVPRSPVTDVPDGPAILGYLEALYTTSAKAREVLDQAYLNGDRIRIGHSPGTAGFYEPSGPVGYIGVDLALAAQLLYFNKQGEVVSELPVLVLIHELAHHLMGTRDTVGTGPNDNPTEADMNQAGFDFEGGTLRIQNEVAEQMGSAYEQNSRVSYNAAFFSSDPRAAQFTQGISYSDGSTINVARLGSGSADDLDMSARPDSVNLVFGLAGNDALTGGAHVDYFYGGAGEDTVSGGAGRDKLLGEADGDFLFGDAGDDILIGGTGNDDLSGLEDNDILYDSEPDLAVPDSDFLDGGSGNDWLVSNGGNDTLLGGVGDDHYLLNIATSYRRVDILDFDPNDRLVWNGHTLSGGLYTLIDGEVPTRQYSTFTQFQYEFYGYVGQLGEIYRYALEIDQLTINLPDGSLLIVQGFTAGEGGIDLNQRTRTGTHERDWFWSNIVNDGQFGEANLEGRAYSLNNRGPVANPDITLVVAGSPDPDPNPDPNGPIEGDAGQNRIEGTAGADVINGHGGNDELLGAAGDDLISGGAGDDLIDGGSGVDTARLSGDQGDYVLNRNADGSVTLRDIRGLDGVDVLRSVETLQFDGNSTSIALALLVADYGTGSSDGWIEGTSGADFLYGLGGDDTLAGREGDDVYDGGPGDDVVSLVGSLTDYALSRNADGTVSVVTLTGIDGSDLLRDIEGVYFETGQTFRSIESLVGEYGTIGSDSWIEGSANGDNLFGLAGDDTLVGRAGDDQLDGGDGYDQANYVGDFSDFIFTRRADGSITASDSTGAEGTDTLVGIEAVYFDGSATWQSLGDIVAGYGTAANDAWVEGTAFSDNIYGLGGDDSLVGREGDDFLYGGDGFDQANYFGSSTDFSFVLNSDGSVTVTDLVGDEGADILSGIEAVYFDGDQVWSSIEDALGLNRSARSTESSGALATDEFGALKSLDSFSSGHTPLLDPRSGLLEPLWQIESARDYLAA